MNKFNNLVAECEFLKVARGYDFLDAVTFILDYEEEYPSEIRRELKEFMRDGRKMFAPRKEVA
jgi:hypothetical protein